MSHDFSCCEADSLFSETAGGFLTIEDSSNAASRVYHNCNDYGVRLDEVKSAVDAVAHSLSRVRRCAQCPKIEEPGFTVLVGSNFSGLCGGRKFGRRSLATELDAQLRSLDSRWAHIDEILQQIRDAGSRKRSDVVSH